MIWMQVVTAPLKADRQWLIAAGFRQTKTHPERFYRFIDGDRVTHANAEVRQLRLTGCGISWRPVRRHKARQALRTAAP